MKPNQARQPASITLNDPRWAALLARDPAAEGQFFYAVTTTGVYCRPTCPARPPRPENVRFFPSTATAEDAGFRPCLRCQPKQPPLAERQAASIAELCRLIDNSATPPTLQQLADHAGLSTYHLHRMFKAVTGLTPKAYASARRSQRLKAELVPGKTVTEAIYNAGYNTSGRFYEQSASQLGMTPGDYRAGGNNTQIRFAIGQCTLGAILVAASAKGVCAILLGDDPAELLRDLQERFPKAALIGDDAGFEAWVAQVVGFVEAPQIGLDLPLDIRGTAFQQRVWLALRAIPAGSTVSYSELARRIGAPRAARAVAGACAANALAVAIPCHRVLRNDGALSGYRWGVERKRALLNKEAES
jgi:AraC family transcriptional regulator of adaptative response/methylated-DNA-[protein]-cysteine methyltransferase